MKSAFSTKDDIIFSSPRHISSKSRSRLSPTKSTSSASTSTVSSTPAKSRYKSNNVEEGDYLSSFELICLSTYTEKELMKKWYVIVLMWMNFPHLSSFSKFDSAEKKRHRQFLDRTQSSTSAKIERIFRKGGKGMKFT